MSPFTSPKGKNSVYTNTINSMFLGIMFLVKREREEKGYMFLESSCLKWSNLIGQSEGSKTHRSQMDTIYSVHPLRAWTLHIVSILLGYFVNLSTLVTMEMNLEL